MRGRVLGLVVLVLAAGCTTVQQPGPQAPDGFVEDPDERVSRTLYLDGEMRLTDRSPTDATPDRVSMGSFYANWTTGDPQPTWTAPALGGAILVDHAQLTFFYTANETAVPTTGPQGEGFPEFVVYVGTEQAPQAWASVEGPDVVREGEVVRVSAEMNLPTGGLVLEPGEEPIVKIAPVQGQGSQRGQVDLLANATETPSRVVLQGQPISLPRSQASPALDETGTLSGTVYVTGPEGPTADNHTLRVPAGSHGFVASLERVQGAGVADIDLHAIGPDGEVVAQSVTPEPREGLAMHPPNLDAAGTGTWTLRVVNVGNAAVEYRLTAELLEPVVDA